MSKHHFAWMLTAIASMASIGTLPTTATSSEPLDLLHRIRRAALGIPSRSTFGHWHVPGVTCIALASVDDQVVGKKQVYDSSVRHEWVTVPETKYRWKKRLVTKEIPCEYHKPLCETTQAKQVVVRETWRQEDFRGGELHWKIQDPQQESIPVKQCKHEPGETTIKVRYWTTVKEPYTVYRQIKRPVCIIQPRNEPATVTVTRQIPVPLRAEVYERHSVPGVAREKNNPSATRATNETLAGRSD
ncbi:MAG: hypothetical protein ACC628_06500 [Pirellulaceae bacterium]